MFVTRLDLYERKWPGESLVELVELPLKTDIERDIRCTAVGWEKYLSDYQ